MIRKPNAFTLTGFVLLLLTYLFVGISKESQFEGGKLFLKYRPTFKTTFFSPLATSNFTYNDLTPEKQEEEKAYQDFVVEHHKLNEQPWIYYLIGYLIQLSVTFLLIGWHKGRTGVSVGWKVLLIHAFVSKVVTMICVLMALVFSIPWMWLGIAGIILVLNYGILWVILWLKEKMKKKMQK